jgi:hypothetical protein
MTMIPAGQEPPSLPDCGLETVPLLRALVGNWTVETEFRTGAAGWQRTDARSSFELDLRGCVLVERYSGTREGRPFDILGVMGVNGDGPRIQRVWAHSQHGLLTLYAGDVRDGELVLDATVAVRGEPLMLRLVYTDVGPDGFRFESLRSTDGGTTWAVTWRAKYQRQPAPET